MRRQDHPEEHIVTTDGEADTPTDFSDDQSRRVLTAAARAVASELGRAAAREYFAESVRLFRVSEA